MKVTVVGTVGMIAPRAGLPQNHATAFPCGSGALAAKPVQANQPAHLPTKQRNE